MSVITPVGREEVIYPLDKVEATKGGEAPSGYENYLNQLYEDTGATYLGFIIKRYGGEWDNLIERLNKRVDLRGKEGSITGPIEEDIRRMREMKGNPGKILIIRNPQIRSEIEMWASCRFQPLARTVRGIMHYKEVFEFFARMHKPDATREEIDKMVQDKEAH